jgi:hypothetical protein
MKVVTVIAEITFLLFSIINLEAKTTVLQKSNNKSSASCFSSSVNSFSDSISKYSLNSLYISLFSVNLFENFSIQPELLYSTQDAELEGLGEQIKNELGYISLPVLAKFYLSKNKLSYVHCPIFLKGRLHAKSRKVAYK